MKGLVHARVCVNGTHPSLRKVISCVCLRSSSLFLFIVILTFSFLFKASSDSLMIRSFSCFLLISSWALISCICVSIFVARIIFSTRSFSSCKDVSNSLCLPIKHVGNCIMLPVVKEHRQMADTVGSEEDTNIKMYLAWIWHTVSHARWVKPVCYLCRKLTDINKPNRYPNTNLIKGY